MENTRERSWQQSWLPVGPHAFPSTPELPGSEVPEGPNAFPSTPELPGSEVPQLIFMVPSLLPSWPPAFQAAQGYSNLSEEWSGSVDEWEMTQMAQAGQVKQAERR